MFSLHENKSTGYYEIMEFTNTLIGSYQRRYKRFFCDIKCNENTITTFLPNTGRLTSCLEDNQDILVTHSPNPKRKLPYTVQCVKKNNNWICVNTHLANTLFKEALTKKELSDVFKFTSFKPELKHSNSRFDFALSNNEKLTDLIEIKSVTLLNSKNLLSFPDAPSTRAQKHVKDLIEISKQSNINPHLVFIIQRNDGEGFEPASDIDPTYAALFNELIKSSVTIHFYRTCISEKRITLNPTPILAQNFIR